MRKRDKDQCTELLRSLMEAHGIIAKDIQNKKKEEAAALLEQCQQGAASVGTLIEGREGEGTRAVAFLEDYCEQVYRCHEALNHSEGVDPGKFQKKLQRLLLKAESSIQNEIRAQVEAVFLPYKASMWDSLESVWRAADEDPDCTAYVIPIPYYDRGCDGGFCEEHYEGFLYPKDVPVVDYRDYDFESRRPDMIFIHNPYDAGNYVTSVLPFFYSENLKRYTDCLIYIPYFILDEPDLSDSGAAAGMEHFCTAPAVLNADYVVVQSEAMRKLYIKVLTKYSGKDKKPYWEKKILGLGSPKVDRVLHLQDEDLELPHRWKQVILKADGSRKGVIFYNTGIAALLKDNDKMMDKICEVHRIFKENQEETALLWRPHPLIEPTLRSMRPKLLGRYKQIVKRYKREGWGIYDDSPNLDRAIAVSDAYYGDWSSVVWLYKKTGKPVMIQNCENVVP